VQFYLAAHASGPSGAQDMLGGSQILGRHPQGLVDRYRGGVAATGRPTEQHFADFSADMPRADLPRIDRVAQLTGLGQCCFAVVDVECPTAFRERERAYRSGRRTRDPPLDSPASRAFRRTLAS
jgi:hypothetical protein